MMLIRVEKTPGNRIIMSFWHASGAPLGAVVFLEAREFEDFRRWLADVDINTGASQTFQTFPDIPAAFKEAFDEETEQRD